MYLATLLIRRRVAIVLVAGLLGTLLWTAPGQGASIVFEYRDLSNPAPTPFMTASAFGQYVAAGSGAADQDSDGAFGSPQPPQLLQTASINLLPAGGGDPKDIVTGTVESEFIYGTPHGPEPVDTIRFDITSTVSAFDSFNSANNPADARFVGSGSFEVFIGTVNNVTSANVGPNVMVGQLLMSPLRSLLPFETVLEVELYDDSGLLLTQAAGSPAQSVPIFTDNTYALILNYEMDVPYGVDPTYNVAYEAFVLVPEPSTAVLGAIGVALLGIGGWRARRKHGAG